MFHQSGGCCDGSSPMCYPAGEFKVGGEDVRLGAICGSDFWMWADQYEFFAASQLIIDVVPGRGSGFSLEAPEGVRFLTRSQLFTDEELVELERQGPLRAGAIPFTPGERASVVGAAVDDLVAGNDDGPVPGRKDPAELPRFHDPPQLQRHAHGLGAVEGDARWSRPRIHHGAAAGRDRLDRPRGLIVHGDDAARPRRFRRSERGQRHETRGEDETQSSRVAARHQRHPTAVGIVRQPSVTALAMSIRRWSHARRPWPPEAILQFGFAALVLALLLGGREAAAEAAPAQEIRIAYLGQANPEIPAGAVEPLPPPADEGVQGARLGIADNNTTGQFLNQTFRLDERRVSSADEVAAAVHDIHASGVKFLVADVAAVALDRVLAVPEASDMLVFNAGAPDDRFRNEDCRPFLLHTLPSRAMLADALAQYLVKKNWTQWFLVAGDRPEDRALRGGATAGGRPLRRQHRRREDLGRCARGGRRGRTRRRSPCSRRASATTC